MSDPTTQPLVPVPAGISISSETSKERRERRVNGKKRRRNNKGTMFKEAKFTGHIKELRNEIYDLT